MTPAKKIRKRKKSLFDPTHKYISDATEKFLNNGGEITTCIISKQPDGKYTLVDADKFLMGF